MKQRIAIIGGLGHVGLPLCETLADCGYPVAAIDRDEAKAALVRSGRMPFIEYGSEEVLRRVIGKTLTVPHLSELGPTIAAADCIIITIGTPLDEHLNPRLEPVINCISDLLPHLRDGQHIMLRSTVFPGTTRRVEAFLRGSGKQIDVSFCPERIVQGHAIKELRELPHVVSGCTPEAVRRAKAIFQRLSGQDTYEACVEVTPEEAELTKLFLNSWRYIQFAAANQFYTIADKLGADYERIRHAMTWRYPRGESLPGPGFAAGPCLVKDTMQLAAACPDGFQLGQAARLVNEGLPRVLVEQAQAKLGSLQGRAVGVLGMAFKANNDDTRDSLSFKLKKLLEFAGASVLCTDELARGTWWSPADEVVGRAELIIVAVMHASYKPLLEGVHKPIISTWGGSQ